MSDVEERTETSVDLGMRAATRAESRMLIDGKLVPASGGRTYDNVNPATEQVIGVTADATADDIGDAIAAARRAFDETSWATDPEFRAKAIRQLSAALDADPRITGLRSADWSDVVA